jgi:hypothetical protein
MFFLIVVNIVLTINLFKPNNPTKIFNNNIESIVEIKASSESVGESFGTGIIYSNDGYLYHFHDLLHLIHVWYRTA